MVEENGVDPQTGFGPVIWNAWETNWSGEINVDVQTRNFRRGPDLTQIPRVINRGEQWRPGFRTETREFTSEIVEETTTRTSESGVMSRDGVRTIVTEQFDMESVGDRLEIRLPYMRSRTFLSMRKLKVDKVLSIL